ncbi:MAG TPA: hypothetical protein ENG63_01120 [Candidatus Desulfofervidus auxilii]|uniref:Uncharacterized protein n=1 Tax=Desulfofervidus auxilii TaxID=1621989 RepID=A0A7C0Y8X2_DESA2|nr:hypothetical protein [Candidatus Desulfofervidus auxilii]
MKYEYIYKWICPECKINGITSYGVIEKEEQIDYSNIICPNCDIKAKKIIVNVNEIRKKIFSKERKEIEK